MVARVGAYAILFSSSPPSSSPVVSLRKKLRWDFREFHSTLLEKILLLLGEDPADVELCVVVVPDAEDSVARLDALVVVGEGFVLPQSFGEDSIFLDLRVD